MNVIITVPHAKPFLKINHNHHCDTSSLPTAEFLKAQFDAKSIVNALFIGDINRMFCDLNRNESRWKTAFREKVRNAISKEKGKPVWVLDVHSFPKDSIWKHYEVVIIDPGSENLSSDALSLYHFLYANKYHTTLFQSSFNDIIIEARELGAKALTIEVNEGLSKEKLYDIASAISKFVISGGVIKSDGTEK